MVPGLVPRASTMGGERSDLPRFLSGPTSAGAWPSFPFLLTTFGQPQHLPCTSSQCPAPPTRAFGHWCTPQARPFPNAPGILGVSSFTAARLLSADSGLHHMPWQQHGHLPPGPYSSYCRPHYIPSYSEFVSEPKLLSDFWHRICLHLNLHINLNILVKTYFQL